MGGKQLGPRWGADAGRFAAFPHAGCTGSEASPWVAAGDELMGKRGQYFSALPRAMESSLLSSLRVTLCPSLCALGTCWDSQIPRIGVDIVRKQRQGNADVGQVSVFWVKPPIMFLLPLKRNPVKAFS